MKCPKCGGENVSAITQTYTRGKDFSAGKGLCGYFLIGPVGLLCGMCGEGKTTRTDTYWLCNDCGSKFKA